MGFFRESTMGQLTLSNVWKQKQIPVVLRRTGRGEQLRARLPFGNDNRQWVKNGRRTAPKWIGGSKAYWGRPQSRVNDIVAPALRRDRATSMLPPSRGQRVSARA